MTIDSVLPAPSRAVPQESTSSTYAPSSFGRRHIGPDRVEQRRMLVGGRLSSIDELHGRGRSRRHPVGVTIDSVDPARCDRAEAIAELRAFASRNARAPIDDRSRLLRHDHARRDQAERAREPQLVHRVHALPARDLAGSARGAAQLPDDGRRPDRTQHGERVDARRVDRRRRGNAARSTCLQVRLTPCSSSTPTRCRRAPRCSRTGRRPSGSSSSRRPRTRAAARRRVLRRPDPVPGCIGSVWDPVRRHRRREGGGAVSSSSPPTCSL